MSETQETSTGNGGRKQVRAPVKEGEIRLRAGEHLGRNGEILKRVPFKGGNKFDIPDDVKEPGWSYQWIRHSIYNSTDHSEVAQMKRAGWREVHPDALGGYFREQTPEGQNCIIDEGLVLVERPMTMTIEAQQEQVENANRHYRAQIHKIYDETAHLPPGMAPLRRGDRFGANIGVEMSEYEEAPAEWQPTLRRGNGEFRPRPRRIQPDAE